MMAVGEHCYFQTATGCTQTSLLADNRAYCWKKADDSTPTLSFSEDEDASQCAVPISTSVIKQILSKARNEENLEDILADFYGPKTPTGPPWPYVSKDAHR